MHAVINPQEDASSRLDAILRPAISGPLRPELVAPTGIEFEDRDKPE